MSAILKTTGANQRDITNGQIVTKLYDLGDVSIVKKFSSCLITYRMWGGGVSPLKVMYRIDERGSFKNFNVVLIFDTLKILICSVPPLALLYKSLLFEG